MNTRTTILLLLVALMLGGYIGLVERQQRSLEERREIAWHVLRMIPDQITFIRFEGDEQVIECVRKEGMWMLHEPVHARADGGEIDRLINGLRTLQRGEVITAREREQQGLTLADYGLERPRRRLMFGDERLRRVILIGRTAPLGDAVYVMESGQEDIVAMDRRLFDYFPEDAVTLRDRIVLHGDPLRVNRLEIRRPGGFLQLARAADGSWRIQQPVQARADRAAVENVLTRLFQLRVREFVADEVSDTTAYGLDDTVLQVTVWPDTRETGDTILLGPPLERADDLIYARRHPGDSVFALPADILDAVRVRPEALRDRQLIPMKDYHVGSVRIERGEQAVHLKRAETDTWQVVEPRNWKADRERVQSLLTAWTGARVRTFIDDPEPEEWDWPEEDPLTLILSERAAGATETPRQYALIIGPVSPDGGRIVKFKGAPTLYEIADDILQTVSLDPLYYRDRRVFAINPEQVRRIRLEYDGRKQVVVRGPDQEFVPDVEQEGEVRPAAIADMLETLSVFQVMEYAAKEEVDREVHGLDTPTATLTLGLTGENGIARTIYFGATREDGSVYAMSRGQDVIFLVDRDTRIILLRDLLRKDEETDG